MVKAKVIVIDLSVKYTSPAGSCVLSQLMGLSRIYEIHLFASEVDTTLLEHITYHQVRVFRHPLVLRYLQFSFQVNRKVKKFLKNNKDVALIQTTQGQYPESDIVYPHFCHKAYLADHWKENLVSGPLRYLRQLNHWYNARMEAKAFRNAKFIVVPSEGLRKELSSFYPDIKAEIRVIPNPIDTVKFARPIDFDRAKARHALGISTQAIVVAFVALGNFSRKGLPVLLESFVHLKIKDIPVYLLVIGGSSGEVRRYRKMSIDMGIEDKIKFVGFKLDIRPYLFLSDLFTLPSSYEIFPLVAIQAAASGLPLMVSRLYGVDEYLENGRNGWLIARDSQAIAELIKRIVDQQYDLPKMGKLALEAVAKYDHQIFKTTWLECYSNAMVSKQRYSRVDQAL